METKEELTAADEEAVLHGFRKNHFFRLLSVLRALVRLFVSFGCVTVGVEIVFFVVCSLLYIFLLLLFVCLVCVSSFSSFFFVSGLYSLPSCPHATAATES